MKVLKCILFYIWSFTGGALASIVGLVAIIPFVLTGQVQVEHGRLCGVFPRIFGYGGGFTLGCFIFVSYDCGNDAQLISHELGHTRQNLIGGPLMLFVIFIPSMIRFGYRQSLYKQGIEPKTGYDAIGFEGQATRGGRKYYLN